MEIIEYLKKELEKSLPEIEPEEIGKVLEIKDKTLKISGLKNIGAMEMIEVEGKEKILGLALNLEEETVGAIIFGEDSKIKQGDIVKRTKKILSIPVGEEVVGRIINPLGEPLDGKGKIESKIFYPLEKKAPSVIEREPVNFPLHTGLKIIDALTPIGRGQRELILGDRICAKDSLVIDTILNQKEEPKRPICIYVAIGQKRSKIAKIIELFRERGALEYTILVVASASDPISFWYLAPYAGVALGEYFMDQGKDALVVFDDLTKHAFAWRQISLILRRPPGREAYPGDIFYLHSRLLERAAKLSKEKGGGSLTALPIIETQAGDISAYIPTNVISICDGQIYLDPKLLFRGQKPEMHIGLSVSRVGSAAQTKAMKKVAGKLKLELAQFQELESFLEFAQEVDPQTRKRLKRGQRIREILKQEELSPLPFEKQVAIIFAGVSGLLDDLPLKKIKTFEQKLYEYLEYQKPEILKKIRETRDLDQDLEIQLEKAIRETKKLFNYGA